LKRICNPASVAARTCDQLKPELAAYEQDARAYLKGGFGQWGVSQVNVCRNAEDCLLPAGCSTTTSTCSSCIDDSECRQNYGTHMCSNGQCVEVECLLDADCGFRPTCNKSTHTCVECLTDAQCAKDSPWYPACDTTRNKCVACNTDAHCALEVFKRCKTAGHICVECLSDQDCVGGLGTKCDTTGTYYWCE
jgi:hypothetical protein